MKLARPKTPRVIIDSNSNEDNTQNDLILKNFSNFMRQIVENENDKFLNGDINLIDYVLSKYLKININDLKSLNKLSIKVNGSYGLLNQFGQRLTELIYLKLNNSFIQNINDLGTNFNNLKILQINDCKLKDLSGIICFEHLEILEAKNNQISDLIELEMCSSIKKLDLENNLIESMENIYFLSSLDGLIYLNLLKNPIKDYEKKLKELLPNIKELNTPNNDLCDEFYNKINNKFSNVKISESVSTNNDSKSINVKKEKEINNNILDNNNSDNNVIKENIEVINNTDNNNLNYISSNNSNLNSINSSTINFSDTNNTTKTKFEFNISLNEFKNNKDLSLKPVITKKKENKEIELLRQSFSRGMNSTRNNLNRYKTTNEKKFETGPGFNFFTKNEGATTGIKCLKGLRNKQQLDKISFNNKGENKFFEELKNRRFIGNQ